MAIFATKTTRDMQSVDQQAAVYLDAGLDSVVTTPTGTPMITTTTYTTTTQVLGSPNGPATTTQQVPARTAAATVVADVIAKNRSKFENLLRNESQAEALERMEKEISDQEDLEYALEVAKKNRIDDILMGREVGFNIFAKTFFTSNRISPMFKRSA